MLGWLAALLLPLGAAAQPEGAFITRFDAGEGLGEGWQISHFAMQDENFRAAWTRDTVTLRNGALELTLLPAPEESVKEFNGAEVQRRNRTHYGRYEVEMTPARGHGVISSFFTYTGPFFGDAQDEIDFEFLGRDTSKVWVTRFADGERLPGEWLPLGFDAAEGRHLYTFDWSPDDIIWYVDGVEFFRVSSADRTLPDTPGRVMISIWPGGEQQAEWSGVAPVETEASARYFCISYRPPGSDADMCSDGR